ncbi:MAG: ribosomal protein [Candidatus Saccharibacteria bacterium]|nr:ribosomal protein [Candidatus Saccharibacteria bacterium]
MKYHELKSTKQKPANRVGRGIAAGQGKTAGRGTKGYGARTGSKAKPGFAGGQNPLMQALPKLPGFRSYRIAAENVYTGQLDRFAGKTADTAALAAAGLISSPYVNVKLIAKGEVTKKVTVQLQGASASAIAAVQTAGGSFEKVARLGRPSTTENPKKVNRERKPQKHTKKV